MKNMEKKFGLLYETYPFLKDINEKSNGVFEEKLMLIELEGGAFIRSSEDKSCAGFPFVIRGELKIQRINEEGDETNLYTIKKGELCHEALGCFMNCIPLNIEGYAIQDSEIFIVPTDAVGKFLFNDSEFLQFLYKDLYSKFKRIIDKNENIIHEPLDTRLINFLRSKNTNNIYITHNEIAKEIGSSREVISRKLKKLEKEEILALSRGKITLLKDI
ncbi:Crp/Fnr family transcriptional regulator [Clostridium sp. B9]|uniref:Crp/Fnr family transcriptional regulator n=1 Tax=Clostridium sp. B9 TaxID=3423224 RepID=UPI003D2F2439